jgi:hypothetical protein
MGHHNLTAEPLIIGAKAAVEGVDAMKPRNRRARKPRIDTIIKQAEKAGKNVTSVTTPEGVTLTFGEANTDESVTPLEQWRAKRRGQG